MHCGMENLGRTCSGQLLSTVPKTCGGPVKTSFRSRAPGGSRHTHVTRSVNEERADQLRQIPLIASALGIMTVVGNKVFGGASATLVASSSQSRADVATICIAAVLGLTGLQWVSLKPKTPKTVDLDGVPVDYMDTDALNAESREEILRFWDAVRLATKTNMMVVFWKNKCIAHMGYMSKENTIPGSAVCGALCQESQENNVPRCLANLVLFPGRFEFLEYLPSNTQCVHVQPLHPNGVVVLGSATQRSITILDQAWISTWCDKLFVTLDNNYSNN